MQDRCTLDNSMSVSNMPGDKRFACKGEALTPLMASEPEQAGSFQPLAAEYIMDKPEVNIQFLVEECLRGNRKAERRLYDLFYSYGFSIALRYANSREEAEEICADGFIKMFKHLEQYDPEQPFKPWLRRIFVNAAIDHIRKYKKHNSRHFVETDKAEHVSSSFNEAPANLGYEELMQCVHQLPPVYRTVFMLYAIDGYKHHEIAEKLGITVGTSKSNLAKARKKLQELICRIVPCQQGANDKTHKPLP